MLPILLMILKIAGIVILAVLGLVFAVLLLVLLVPVRYSLSGSYYGRFRGTVKVTWFLGALWVKATYEDRLDVIVRVLGKRVLQKKEERFQVKEEIMDDLEEGAGRALDLAEEGLGVDFVETAKEEDAGQGEAKSPEEDRTEDTKPQSTESEEADSHGAAKAYGPAGKAGWDVQEAGEDTGREKRKGREPRSCLRDGRRSKGQKRRFGKKADRAGDMEDQTEDPFGTGFMGKAKGAAESVKNAWSRMEEYKEKALSFWNDERNKKTVKVIFRQVRAVICHILPKKIQGKAVFGFDDPAVTGKVLAGFSTLYGFYGDKIQIVPVFDRKILEAEGSLKGRVQAGVFVARGIRVLLNKNFRRLVWGFLKNGGK